MAMKDTNEDKPNNGNDSEDNFGLPDLDYKPIDRTEEKAGKQPEESTETTGSRYTPTYGAASEEKSKAPVIIGLIIGLVIMAAVALIYWYVWRPAQLEKERQELALKKEKEEQEAKRKAEEQEKARLAEEEGKRREAEEAAKANPPVGTIETLAARTGRYYVVISSAVDGDLSMDYAKKLSAKGVNIKLIPPFGKWKYNRVAVADHPDFTSAQADADAKKGEYGNDLWVIKY